MNLIKGIRNLFMISTPNILIVLCILLIVSLIYLNSNSIELFSSDYLTLFIDRYITKIQNNNEYKSTLATQEQRIKDLSDSVIKLINP